MCGISEKKARGGWVRISRGKLQIYINEPVDENHLRDAAKAAQSVFTRLPIPDGKSSNTIFTPRTSSQRCLISEPGSGGRSSSATRLRQRELAGECKGQQHRNALGTRRLRGKAFAVMQTQGQRTGSVATTWGSSIWLFFLFFRANASCEFTRAA